MAVQAHHTVEEFDHLAALPENADRRLEYVGGEIVEVASNNYSSLFGVRISARLLLFVEQRGLGFVTGADGGYSVSGERYIPDVAFISKVRQPEPSREAYNPLSPDLAVEILSPSNDLHAMRLKIANYLTAGTVVWVVRPDTEEVEVYTPGRPARKLSAEDVLDGGETLPGFALPIKDLFPG